MLILSLESDEYLKLILLRQCLINSPNLNSKAFKLGAEIHFFSSLTEPDSRGENFSPQQCKHQEEKKMLKDFDLQMRNYP